MVLGLIKNKIRRIDSIIISFFFSFIRNNIIEMKHSEEIMRKTSENSLPHAIWINYDFKLRSNKNYIEMKIVKIRHENFYNIFFFVWNIVVVQVDYSLVQDNCQVF
jgi:hypothetical protein